MHICFMLFYCEYNFNSVVWGNKLWAKYNFSHVFVLATFILMAYFCMMEIPRQQPCEWCIAVQ